MKRKIGIGFLCSLMVFGLLILSPFNGNAYAAPTIIKFSHQWPKGDIRDQWANKWADLVKEKTGGAVVVRIYPSASLYKSKMQADAMAKGALDASCFPLIYLAGKNPAYAITSMPCVVKNAAQGAKWGSSEIGRKLNEIGIEYGFHTVSFGCIMGSIGSRTQPVLLPKDVEGMKVRGAGWAMEEVLEAGGASITSMPSTETYFALQTGALDGLTTTYSSFISFRLNEVLKHFTYSKDYNIFFAHHAITVANKTWDRLNEDERKALSEAGKETESYMLEKANGVLEKAIAEYKSKGVQLHEMSEENFNVWLELAKQTAFKTFVKKVPNGEELLKLALEVK
jgi:TRAP-type transport system periplasmic protein